MKLLRYGAKGREKPGLLDGDGSPRVLPVVFAVVNTRQYAILKGNLAGSGGQAATSGRYVAMDLDSPPVDYVSLARGLGVDAVLAEKATDVADAARAAFDAEKPFLIEIPISAK